MPKMIGGKIKELREERKITQEKLAADLNLTRSSLSLYELGTRKVPSNLLYSLSQYFEVSTDYFFGLKDD